MSTSPARLAANAANAQHSTGPRTLQGQARSSQNARTHGLTARDLIVAPNESKEFEQLLNDYQTEVQPQGAIQQTLFDELVGAAWNLRRVRRMEVQLCSDTQQDDDELQKKLDRLARHKTRIERTFHRSLKELKALQTNAVFQEAIPSEMRLYVPALSNAAAISKRTQQVAERNQLHCIKATMDAPMPQSPSPTP
jgi:glycine cleavage system pyridoxal-binding protein P